MIDAAIVRVAKARRLISHNELLAEVTQQILNFKAQPAQVRVFAYNERLGIGLACLVAWFAWALTHVSVNPIHNPPAPKTRQIKKRIAGLIEKVKCSCLISTLKTHGRPKHSTTTNTTTRKTGVPGARPRRPLRLPLHALNNALSPLMPPLPWPAEAAL